MREIHEKNGLWSLQNLSFAGHNGKTTDFPYTNFVVEHLLPSVFLIYRVLHRDLSIWADSGPIDMR